MNGLALCAGVGGLELGLQLAIPTLHPVCYVEREAYAAAVLVSRMAEGRLRPAPIWDELSTFDGRRWRGLVHLVSAGYPCQPESVAGDRRGVADERWMWNEVWRIVCQVRPRYLFLENVAAHLAGTFGRVVGDLAAGGWRVEWDCIPAAAVGAPHLRDRLFILASHPDGPAIRLEPERDQRGRWTLREAECGHAVAGNDGAPGAATNADGVGLAPQREGVAEPAGRPGATVGGARDDADTAGLGCAGGPQEGAPRGRAADGGGDRPERAQGVEEVAQGPATDAGGVRSQTRPAGRNGQARGRSDALGRRRRTAGTPLAHADHEPAGPEQEQQPGEPAAVAGAGRLEARDFHPDPVGDGRQGKPPTRLHDRGQRRYDLDRLRAGDRGQTREPWRERAMPQPAVRRMDDGLAHRLDRLYVAGNGVVPEAAYRALKDLWPRLHETL